MTASTDPRRPRRRQAKAGKAVVGPAPAVMEEPFDEPAMPAPPIIVPVEEPVPAVRGDDAETCEPTAIQGSEKNESQGHHDHARGDGSTGDDR
jgi:hypothetical protein